MKRILIFIVTVFSIAFLTAGCGKDNRGGLMFDRNEDFTIDAFGRNTYFFTPDDDPSEVKEILDDIWSRQENNQFGDDRYAVYFLPGKYDDNIKLKVGFYTQAAGLGKLPTDTVLHTANVDARWLSDDSNHNATCNFWRGIENLSISDDMMWAVSQATFMRRLEIGGSLYLHDNYGWASGGFTSDTRVAGMIDSGSQQQWLSRNNEFKTWMGENWNLVFLGDKEGCDPTATWPGKAYTAVAETPVIREKPFLVYDEAEGFGVFVPNERLNSKGISWDNEAGGEVKSLSDFYVARAGIDDAKSINAALSEGKSIFFTAGIYEISEPITVENDGVILLSSGLATLRNTSGNQCIKTKNARNIIIAGLLLDAGEGHTDTMMTVGDDGENSGEGRGNIYLSDLFFRIGGVSMSTAPTVESCLVINSDNVIGDNFWIWRADHGDNVGWEVNSAKNGLTVNGRNVSIYALMVEHFEEYQTIWNGENGLIVMYQSELPYDVPQQSVWKSHGGEMDGYASVYVSPDVKEFKSYGLGIYSFHRDAAVVEHCVVETPVGDGIKLHNTCAIMITGYPGISHVINDEGKSCVKAGDKAMVIDY